ncbi:MAG: hypothetical protein ACOCVV_08555 [Marinobacter sp.]
MRWRVTRAEGFLAGVPLADILAQGGVLPGLPQEFPGAMDPAGEQAWVAQQLGACLTGERPTWVILPDRQRNMRHLWQDQAAGRVEVGFGRSGVTLALSQINRLQAPATLVAFDRMPGAQPDHVMDSRLRLDLEPHSTGLGLQLNLVDGRLDGDTDMSSLLEQARAMASAPDALVLPGTGNDTSLDRLMPALGALGDWVDRDVRWEFPEARIGPLGVAGSLFNWYWLQEGYRMGDWQGPVVVLDMDTSPLVGLSVADYNA